MSNTIRKKGKGKREEGEGSRWATWVSYSSTGHGGMAARPATGHGASAMAGTVREGKTLFQGTPWQYLKQLQTGPQSKLWRFIWDTRILLQNVQKFI